MCNINVIIVYVIFSPLEDELLQRRAWKWDIEPFDSDDIDDTEDFEFQEESHSTCGTLDVKTYSDHHIISKRAVKSITKDPKDIQTEDALETEQIPTANSKEIENPPETNIRHSSHPAQKTLLRWIEQMNQHINGRGIVHNANDVKEYINNQRDRMGEKIENDHEFTTNLNEAIEPVKPTEKTDFSIQRNKQRESKIDESDRKLAPIRSEETLFQSLPTNLRDSKFKQGEVTPKSIPATPASLVSVPTRPTMAVFIPLPTDPASENITSLNGKENGSLTDPKVGLPIPTVSTPENITKTKINMYPEDDIDYDDLLLNEKKKISNQSSVVKPPLGTKFLKTTVVPTPPSINGGNISTSSSSRKTLNKIKDGAHTGSINITSENVSTSSSEEKIQKKNLNEFTKLSESMGGKKGNKTKKEEKMNEILESLVSSSEDEKSKEDSEEIDDPSEALHNMKSSEEDKQQHHKQINSKNETGEVFLGKAANNHIPPAIEIKKSEDRLEKDSLDSSKLSDERGQQVSETDELILTDEIKSESVEDPVVDTLANGRNSNDTDAESKEKNELQPEKTKNNTKEWGEKIGPKPVSINIGLEDSDDLKAYWEAMKPSTNENIENEATIIDSNGDSSEKIDQQENVGRNGKSNKDLKSTTLFNTKTDYDLTEPDGVPKTAENTEGISELNTHSNDISEEQTDEKGKKENSQEGDYTKEEILLNLPPPQIKLASKPKERIRKLKNLDHYTDAVNSTGKDEKTSSKTSNRNMGVAIPIMPTDDNDDSYLNEYIKAVRDTAPLSDTKSTEQLQTIKAQAKGIHTNVDRTNMKKTNITNKARSSSVSSDKSESSSSSIEKESDYSDSLSSESISFEDEEKDRDKKLSMNRKGRTKTSGSQSNASNQNNAPIKQANDKTGKKVKAVKENEESRFNEHKKQSNNKLKVRKPDEDPQSTSQKHDSNSDSEVSDVESESEEISDEGSSEEFESLEDTKEANDVSTTKHNKEGTQSSIKERKQSSSKISTSKSPENLESKSIISNEKVIETTRLPPKININAPPVGKNGIDGDDSLSEESKFDSEISPTTTQTSITVAVPFNTKKKNNELPKVPKSNNIGGIIIPTQSDILFGSMTEKSDSHENKMEPIDNDSSTASSNIKKAYVGAVENDHDSVPITKVQILREKSAKTMETVTASSEESKEENVHSSNLPPLTSSSHMDISSTQTEEVDNSDLLSVDREYESDGAKLALDIIDKNRIDSYSSDEESLENTSVRPTTISPEEEDYDTTSSGEDLSEEIKGRVSESSTHVSYPKSAKESSLVNKHDSDERDRESSAQIVKEAFPKGKVEPDENDDSLRSDITESHNNQRIHSSEEIDIPITKVNNSVVFTTNLKKDKTGLSNEIKTKLMKDRETKMQTINEISQKDSLWNGSIETASATTSIPLSTLPSYEKKIGNKEKDKDNHHSFESDISKESPILTNSSLPSMDGIKRESVRNDRLKNGLTENKNMENRDISNGNASENINRPQEMKNTTTEKSNMEMDIETEDSNENTESNSRESIESLDESLDSEEKSVHSSTNEGGSLDQNNKENQGELIELDLKGEKNRSFTESTDTTVSLESVERSKEADEVENVKTMQFAEDKSLQKSANDIKTNDKSTRESTEVVKEDDSSESKNDDDDQSMQSVEEVPNEFTSMEEKNAESSDGYKEFSSSNDKYNKQSMHSEDHRDDSSPESTPDVKNITSKVSLDKSTNVGSSENEVHEKSLTSIIEDNGSLLKPINDEKTYQNNSTESIEISEEVESSEDNHNDQALDSVIHKGDGSNNSTSQVNVDRESSKDSVEKSKEVESSEHKTDEQSLELVEHKNESSTNPTPQVDSVSKSSKDSLEISKDVESSADDPPKQYRSSDENKLARSNSYEVKDYYDENNELFNEPEDEAMYMKEVNRDKLERDKNYEIESSQEIPIVLEDIINIDDSREKTTIIHSDEAFRSLIEKMNNKSRDLMTEAASKDEVRHKEDQDLDSTGIVGGDISDDADMDPEDILAHEADLKAEANVNEALLPRFSNPRTMMKKNPKNGKASMSLSNCYLPRTSMCYTYPVTVDNTGTVHVFTVVQTEKRNLPNK